MLREKCRCARKGVITTSDITNHGSGEVGHNLYRFESVFVQDAGLVPISCRKELGQTLRLGVGLLLTDEDVTASRKDV